MGTYDEVLKILNWPAGVAPAPNATAQGLLTMDAATVADKIEASCYGIEAPYGYPGTDYEWTRYAKYNEGVKFWELTTAQALGIQPVDPPLDKVEEAKTVSEWWNAQDHNRNRLGFKLWNVNDEASVAQHEKQFAAALTVPPEWATGTDPVIYQLACREGYLKPKESGFHAVYTAQTPRFADVRGLSAQQWLDNLRAADRGQPRPWNPVKPANPVPA